MILEKIHTVVLRNLTQSFIKKEYAQGKGLTFLLQGPVEKIKHGNTTKESEQALFYRFIMSQKISVKRK